MAAADAPEGHQVSSVVGIDIGGTKMLGGLLTASGAALATETRPTLSGSYLADVERLAGAMVTEAERRGLSLAGIGVGTTGMVDHAAGVLRRSMGLGVRDLPIRAVLEATYGLPAFVDNDIHAAALGELMFGVGRRYRDFLLVNAGTGLAVGMVLGGRLHRGVTNVAGEVGHTSVVADGDTCGCGLPGCVEGMVVRARAGETVRPVALARFPVPAPDVAYAYLALATINLVNFLNPAAVVLAGGMFTRNPEGAAWVAEAVRRCALESAAEGLVHVGVSEAGPEAGLVGAAALVLEGTGAVAAGEVIDA